MTLIDEGYRIHEISKDKNIHEIIYKTLYIQIKSKNLPEVGNKPFTLDYEIHLCKYIDDLRKLYIPVSTGIAIIKVLNIIPFFSKIYNAYHQLDNFLKRNRYSTKKMIFY